MTNIRRIKTRPYTLAGPPCRRGPDPEGERLVAREADARGYCRGLAVSHGAERTPGPPAENHPGGRERAESDRPGEAGHPVVRGHRPAEDLDVRDRPRELRRPEELNARASARELLETLDGRGHRDGDRERGQREVEAREPERRQSEG